MPRRSRRLPKAESVDFVVEKSGDLMIRCRHCDAVLAVKSAWTHRCSNAATGRNLDAEGNVLDPSDPG